MPSSECYQGRGALVRLNPIRFFSATIVEVLGALALVWMLPQVDWQRWTSELDRLVPQAAAQTTAGPNAPEASNWFQLPAVPATVQTTVDRSYTGPAFPAPTGSDPWYGEEPMTATPWQAPSEPLPHSVASQYEGTGTMAREQYVEQKLDGASQRLLNGITGYIDSAASQILTTEAADQKPSLAPQHPSAQNVPNAWRY